MKLPSDALLRDEAGTQREANPSPSENCPESPEISRTAAPKTHHAGTLNAPLNGTDVSGDSVGSRATYPEFVPFPKMARFSREVIVTEKIDGTNALIHFADDGQMFVGSRTRWITPEQDNFGFARWAYENAAELRKLGPGSHFGEWWGKGIQRGYGLSEKRFSLFNVSRWSDPAVRPACCGVVPELFRCSADELGTAIPFLLNNLRLEGSRAAPGFMRPEGIVIFHVAAGVGFKKTLERDHEPKGAATDRGAA